MEIGFCITADFCLLFIFAYFAKHTLSATLFLHVKQVFSVLLMSVAITAVGSELNNVIYCRSLKILREAE
jgi:hypothetical protein